MKLIVAIWEAAQRFDAKSIIFQSKTTMPLQDLQTTFAKFASYYQTGTNKPVVTHILSATHASIAYEIVMTMPDTNVYDVNIGLSALNQIRTINGEQYRLSDIDTHAELDAIRDFDITFSKSEKAIYIVSHETGF